VKRPENVLLSGRSLYKYIPHRPPVFLIDSYYGRDGEASYSGYTPVKDSFFCPGETFLEEGIIEHAAQSVALAAGVDTLEQGGEVVPGFVGSVNDYHFYEAVHAGDKIVTSIKEIHKFTGFSVIKVKTFFKDRLVAEGEFKVVTFNGLIK
jgi:3-hydroxymyristoyl/3-hydroxydecanoyl-(acyl carrier protein) dehydratase